ncbi:MAG: flavin reductase family protein [Gemmatimonadetes bacterium]|nr:flavin reductase family protein [Gemmatimonadota bacterium]
MARIPMGPDTSIYPMPAFLIGADVDGKPNFMTAAWSGIVNSTPPMVSVAIRASRHTFKGVKQNSSFSVNVPSVAQAVETDYCGIVSGARADKAAVCGFEVFYGRLGNAPMIEQCPVNLECRVAHALDLGSHTLFIGEIVETYISEECTTDGKADVDKIEPLIYVRDPEREYRALGRVVAKAWRAGLELRDAG